MPLALDHATPAHIWVVSDHPERHASLWDALRTWGFRVTLAGATPASDEETSGCCLIHDLPTEAAQQLRPPLPGSCGTWLILCDPAECGQLATLLQLGLGDHLIAPRAEDILEHLVNLRRRRSAPPGPRLLALAPAGLPPGLAEALDARGIATEVVPSLEGVLKALRQPDRAAAMLLLCGQPVELPAETTLAALRRFHPNRHCHIGVLELPGDGQPPLPPSAAADLWLKSDAMDAAGLAEALSRAAVRASNFAIEMQQRRSLARGGEQWLIAREHALVTIADTQGVLRFASQRLCDLLGFDSAALLGNTFLRFSPELQENQVDSALESMQQGHVWTGPTEATHRDGSTLHFETTLIPLRDEAGKLLNYLGIHTDITRQRSALEALAESEERLRHSQEFAELGMWDWDLATHRMRCSPQFARLFGFDENLTEFDDALLFEVIPEDDQQLLGEELRRCLATGSRYQVDHRVRLPDGSTRWLHERGDVLRGPAGQPLRMIGVTQDVGRRKQAELSVERQKQLLDVLHQASSRYVESLQAEEASNFLIHSLMELTDSTLSMIGEVRRDADGSPLLRLLSAGERAPCTVLRDWVGDASLAGFEFRGTPMITEAIRRQQPLICNDGYQSPPGFPDIDNFIFLPIKHRGEMVGLLSIANRREGCSEALVDFLAPFTATCGVLIHAMRMENARTAEQQALRQAKDEAEQANRAKSAFLSSMSHELRTPLNAILGFAQLLEAGDALPAEERRHYVQLIEGAGWHLLDLINDVLDLARIEAGGTQLKLEPVGLQQPLDECLKLLAPLAVGSEVALHCEPLPPGACVLADHTRVRQVLLNLLGNAIKYNHPGGEVRIRAELQPGSPDCWHVAVEDTGIGLTPGQLADLFQPFNRLGAERSNIEGTGIGLAITRQLIELMQGRFGVESTPGQGSRFWFELPAADSAPVRTGAAAGPERAETAPAAGASRKRTVLYVEDNPTNLLLVSRVLLKQPDIHLLTAESGAAGLAIARSALPDLLILDIHLPDMDGYQILAALRQDARTAGIPAIALSANAMPADIQRGGEAGFVEYIPKPLRLQTFIASVRRALGEA